MSKSFPDRFTNKSFDLALEIEVMKEDEQYDFIFEVRLIDFGDFNIFNIDRISVEYEWDNGNGIINSTDDLSTTQTLKEFKEFSDEFEALINKED